MLPQEMGCGSGMTCWRRLQDWQKAGVWDCLQHVLLDRLGRRNAVDFRRAALDSASVAAEKGPLFSQYTFQPRPASILVAGLPQVRVPFERLPGPMP
jgi:transposase